MRGSGGLAEALRERGIGSVPDSSPEEARAYFAAGIRKWSEEAQRAGPRTE